MSSHQSSWPISSSQFTTDTMGEDSTHVTFRIPPPPQGFITLNDDTSAVTTRGQRLSSVIQLNRSSNSLLNYAVRPGKSRSFSFRSEHSEEAENDGIRRSKSRLERDRDDNDPRRVSVAPDALFTPQMRSMRLIGNSNPRYKWAQYYKSDEELDKMPKKLREYYERNNFLVAQYVYIDRLLDSSLPHDLIMEYERTAHDQLPMISEEANGRAPGQLLSRISSRASVVVKKPIHRTPKNLYQVPSEASPLLGPRDEEEAEYESYPEIKFDEDEDVDANDSVVTSAIYVNLAANILLLIAKIAVTLLTDSLSVLASLVDSILDFLSTAIVWTTTVLISRQDQYAYPVGRRRLEPVGVLVFSVIMIVSFVQVAVECFNRLIGPNHAIVALGVPAIATMVSTVVIKGLCWFYCRLIKNSSVQALAQDAMTDVVFNTFSIIFPLVGFYAKLWWMDALGGLLLSLYVIFNWSTTSSEHVRNLCGAAATADERNVLLYLTMRFAKTIKYIQGLQAYHAGDKLNVEVDIVLDENTNLRDSHDISESLQYVLESVPIVDRAFVHTDYKSHNLPSHMNQQGDE